MTFSTDSITVTSDGSAIEARIRLLQKQLLEKQAEAKRVTNEKNRRRKERLRKRELELKTELEVWERRVVKVGGARSLGWDGPG